MSETRQWEVGSNLTLLLVVIVLAATCSVESVLSSAERRTCMEAGNTPEQCGKAWRSELLEAE